jgi:hypothetical protein
VDGSLLDTSAAVRRFIPEAPFSSLRGLARYVAVAGLAGLIAGIVVGGVGGRLFMRIAGAAAPDVAQGAGTEAGFTVGEVTVGGTIGLVLFIGIFVGVIGAAIFVVSMPWLSWAGRWRGVLLGVVLFAAGSATSDVMNPDNFDFFVLKNEVLLVGLIVVLFLAFGALLEWTFRALGRGIPDVGDRWRVADSVFVAIAAVGLMLSFALLPVLFTREACNCDPPLAASWSIVAMGMGTVLWWTSALITGAATRIRTAAGVLGYAGLAGVVVFGLIRAVSDAVEIIG